MHQSLDFAERWLRDGLSVLRPSLFVHQIVVDMTHANLRLEQLRRAGVQASATHLLVHATARALGANPQLHQFIAGNRRHRPDRVDIGLSVTGETFLAPVLVIEGADKKSVKDIAADIAALTPQARQSDQQLLKALRRWGWLLPFGFQRRMLMRLCHRSGSFRRKAAGTFQVSTVPVDWALTATFAVAGVLVGGQVRSRVVAINGQPAVCETMILTLSGDHGIWDGRAAARFLAAVRMGIEAKPGGDES